MLDAARSDPAGFLAGLSDAVVLDEVQRAPELFMALKASVDRDRRPGRFLLTGSADVLLLPELAEALVGRMEILTLRSFSQGEIESNKEQWIDRLFAGDMPTWDVTGEDRTELFARVQRGGYPEVQARSVRRRQAWFDAYVSTLLQRDVRDLANIEALSTMPRLLSLLATRLCALVNFAELSRSTGLPQSTLKRYMALLEATFLVQLLPAWSGNLSKRLVKAPKLLLCDTGLATHALGLAPGLNKGRVEYAGALLENFVAVELNKQATWSQERVQLYHFRTHSGQRGRSRTRECGWARRGD